jgi:hypothetical protein
LSFEGNVDFCRGNARVWRTIPTFAETLQKMAKGIIVGLLSATLLALTACGGPSGVGIVRQPEKTVLVVVKKTPNQGFVVKSVRWEDSKAKKSTDAQVQTTTENGAKAVLNPKGYKTFGLLTEVPAGAGFTPDRLVVNYQVEKGKKTKKMVVKKVAAAPTR